VEAVEVRLSQDSAFGSDNGSKDKQNCKQEEEDEEEEEEEEEPKIYSFLVEDCILKAFQGKNPSCPTHGELMLGN